MSGNSLEAIQTLRAQVHQLGCRRMLPPCSDMAIQCQPDAASPWVSGENRTLGLVLDPVGNVTDLASHLYSQFLCLFTCSLSLELSSLCYLPTTLLLVHSCSYDLWVSLTHRIPGLLFFLVMSLWLIPAVSRGKSPHISPHRLLIRVLEPNAHIPAGHAHLSGSPTPSFKGRLENQTHGPQPETGSSCGPHLKDGTVPRVTQCEGRFWGTTSTPMQNWLPDSTSCTSKCLSPHLLLPLPIALASLALIPPAPSQPPQAQQDSFLNRLSRQQMSHSTLSNSNDILLLFSFSSS